MLCSRYNEGLNLLENYISCGMLCDFLNDFFDFFNESMAWEFWLHKETGKSWGDFKLSVIAQDMDIKKIEKCSVDIEKQLSKGGEWLNGIV